MVGYPYFYEDISFEERILTDEISNKKFMIFTLNPIPNHSESNNGFLTSTIVVTPSNLNLGDEFSYRFCDEISKMCGTFRLIPETESLVLDYNSFCRVVSKSDLIINTIASELDISKQSALEQAQNFFRDKNVIVQPGGVQGTLYKVGSYLQSAGSAGLVTKTITTAKLAGVSGIQILKAQPILTVAIPTTGAIFFYGLGAIVGNNSVGKTLITAGDVCALPMKGVEILWNSYMTPAIQTVSGVPIILNMTQTFKIGPGYTIKEIADHIKITKTSVWDSIKKRVINWLS